MIELERQLGRINLESLLSSNDSSTIPETEATNKLHKVLIDLNEPITSYNLFEFAGVDCKEKVTYWSKLTARKMNIERPYSGNNR